jgi:hypothetical protein
LLHAFAERADGGALTIELSDVTITELGTDSIQDGLPIQEIGLAYRRVTWTFNSGSSSTQASFDVVLGTGTSGGPLRPNFVFFGQGVDPSAFPDETPFSKLTLQLTALWVADRQARPPSLRSRSSLGWARRPFAIWASPRSERPRPQ